MDQHYCQEHNTKFYHNEKNGKSWYSHKTDDPAYPKGYHNEDAPKQENANPKNQGEWNKSLQNDSFYTCNALNNATALVVGGKVALADIESCYDRLLAILKK